MNPYNVALLLILLLTAALGLMVWWCRRESAKIDQVSHSLDVAGDVADLERIRREIHREAAEARLR